MDEERLRKQLAFILELDKMKNIYRQTLVLHEDRQENDAEHSWHLAIMAMILSEYANESVDVLHVMKMVLLHDVVEIDAGDTYAYDTIGNQSKAERELKAAERLFALLPDEQAKEYRSLWDEFEERKTPESKFANTLDRVQPLLLNYHKGGISWKRRGIHAEQVIQRNQGVTEEGSQILGELASEIIQTAKEQGMLK
ncbi:MAG: HD domain-containing protein [Oscillospiraceae bacterium]